MIRLVRVDSDLYEIENRQGELLVDSNEDYYIYMRDVIFRNDGNIEGIYQGENPDVMIDGYCRNVEFSEEDGWRIKREGRAVRKARMVAVKNNSDTIIIIHEN